jgi:hypothetical protein
MTGFLYAVQRDYDFVVRQDGDGQHDPVARFRASWRRSSRTRPISSSARAFSPAKGYQSTVVRRVGIFILGIVSALVGTHVTDPTSGYWAVKPPRVEGAGTLAAGRLPGDRGPGSSPRARRLPGPRATGRDVCADRRPVVDRRDLFGFYMMKVVLALLVGRLRPPLTRPPRRFP